MRKLRRSQGAGGLLDELMMDAAEEALERAIMTISQSDPLIKLLNQVTVGRMKPTDSSLRAIVESWLNTYQKVVETSGLSGQALRRIDPRPRIAVLVDRGVLPHDHPAVQSLTAKFAQAVSTTIV